MMRSVKKFAIDPLIVYRFVVNKIVW